MAENRKEKKLTQEQLAEKLGVTAKTISRWENGNYMPDISLLKPLSEALGITLNDLLSGEKVEKEHYQEKLEENMMNTIDYTSKKVSEKNHLIAQIFFFLGFGIIFTAFTVFPSESSWGSIYSIIGMILSLIGFSKYTKEKLFPKRWLFHLGFLLIVSIMLLGIDFVHVKVNKVAPRFSYLVKTGDQMIIYYSPLCNVYRINQNSQNEYYLIDTQKKYTEETVPISPFNKEKAGIDSIIKYKSLYVGDNSNTGNLIGSLPLSEYGYTFEIDSKKLGVTIHYHMTDWYINENHYLEKSLLYNTVSIFALIDNVQELTFSFSGKNYQVSRETIEKQYPNYKDITLDGIHQENFEQYLEAKMNENELVALLFEQLFFEKVL